MYHFEFQQLSKFVYPFCSIVVHIFRKEYGNPKLFIAPSFPSPPPLPLPLFPPPFTLSPFPPSSFSSLLLFLLSPSFPGALRAPSSYKYTKVTFNSWRPKGSLLGILLMYAIYIFDACDLNF